MPKFGPQVLLTELTPKDYAQMVGRTVWVSVVERHPETDVTTKVVADVVGRVSAMSRVQDFWNDDAYKYGIGFIDAVGDAFTATLPNKEGRDVLVALDLNS
ncbi:hypothetical protein SEA_ZOOMAN_284 [Microbacterium phage Zooman]|nr:hypothetical protein SEA_ZOOMAN_284 [Microbacterium phage Zooman]